MDWWRIRFKQRWTDWTQNKRRAWMNQQHSITKAHDTCQWHPGHSMFALWGWVTGSAVSSILTGMTYLKIYFVSVRFPSMAALVPLWFIPHLIGHAQCMPMLLCFALKANYRCRWKRWIISKDKWVVQKGFCTIQWQKQDFINHSIFHVFSIW